MGGLRILLFALSLCGMLAHGAKLGSCKNCKNKNAATNNSQRLIASPINLLNPDRYEFFTLDDKGKVVKRIMTFKEIQSIVAGSDITELKLFANKHNNDRIVSSVVSNVRNVLNNELNLLNGHDPIEQAELPISDVINVPHEPSATATMYDVLNKLGESLVTATTKRTTTTARPTVSSVEQATITTIVPQPVEAMTLMPNTSTERLTTRLMLKTTPKPTPVTAAPQLKEQTTTEATTSRPTKISVTERTTVRSTPQPTETTAKLRSSTVRPTERSTTELPTVRPTVKPTVAKTTQQPLTTFVQTTRKPTLSSTGRPTANPSTVQSIKHSTVGRSTTTEAPMLLKWAETSLAVAVRLTTEAPTVKPSRPSTTEVSMFKEALPSTAAVRTTEAPTSRTSEMALPIVKTTVASFTKQTAAPPLEHPLVPVSTVKPTAEQSVEHSSQRSEELLEGDNSVEYSTEQSSEKWNDDHSGSGESYTASEETSTGGATQIVLDEAGPTVKTVLVETVTMDVPDSSNTISTIVGSEIVPTQELSTVLEDRTEELETWKDSEISADESSSTEQLFQTTGGLSTWFMDPVTQLVTAPQRTPDSSTDGASDDHLETTFATGSKVDDELATTTSFEADSSTVLDSAGYSDEQSEELPLTTLNRYSEESTTTANGESTDFLQTDPEQTVAQDTSTIPSDAQHAIHKIIESLQSINDNSGSDESDEADSQEAGYPGDVPGMNYDTDAQSSINAIIQSLGQGTLVGGESPIFPITTETITTPEVEHTTVAETTATKIVTPTTVVATETRSPVPSLLPTSTTQQSTTTTMTLPVLETSKPAEVISEEADTTSNFNYNTNIMDTIEKFLSTFASLPKENAYAANLTELNILSDYPAEINMTDYVDRTATVASVLKFPHQQPSAEVSDVTSEMESLEETTATESDLMLEEQPILSETVASFMKLGEMLTMGPKVSSAEIPIPVQLEVKTAMDEEETELLRFLSICSSLGTNVYDSLTDASNARSMSDQSMVYSPFATITTLSMLFLGTRGTTAESINGVIGLDEMTSFNPHLFFKSIAEDLTPKNRRTASLAREDGDIPPDSTFLRTLLSDESRGGLQRFFKARIQEIYSTVAETVDFRQKDMLLRHMSGDFPREYVDTLKQMRSPLVSISRNRYRHECNGAGTSFGTMPFSQRTDRSPSVVPSVTFRSGFSTGYSKVLDATILALPGSTSNVSVYFLKPSTTATTGVTELETHLRNQSISNVLKLFPDETVRTAYAEVQLPHFAQTTIFNMTGSIQQLGLQNLFEPNVANFNGLQDSSTSNLYLSEIIQTDSFALCGGSEMASRTVPLRSFSTNLIKHGGPIVGDRSSDPTSGSLMRRNRRKLAFRNRSAFDSPNTQSKLVFDAPFLYLVRHNPTGMVLYMGRFVGNV